tara:strand:- start:430 stop:702 length:273 start_codon:yes stop_codon:yes gene_type:complete
LKCPENEFFWKRGLITRYFEHFNVSLDYFIWSPEGYLDGILEGLKYENIKIFWELTVQLVDRHKSGACPSYGFFKVGNYVIESMTLIIKK